MANPQLENGHIKIANDIWDALAKIRISGEEWQVLNVILRKTYGWNKKQDHISLSQFVLATGLKKPNIVRARQKLLSKKIIVIKKDNQLNVIYRFNKDFDSWKPLSKKITVIKKDNTSLSKKIPTKDTVQKTKRNICAKTKKNDDVDNNEFQVFYEAYPKKKSKEAAFRAWQKTRKDRPSLRNLLKILKTHVGSEDWKKENGKYIPYPASWLNGRRWEDEVETTISETTVTCCKACGRSDWMELNDRGICEKCRSNQ